MAVSRPPLDKITGTVKRLTFRNDETGYFVAQVVVGEVEKTIVGTTPSINVGEPMGGSGSWAKSQWGTQFKASDVSVTLPTQVEGILKYLSTSLDGIGPSFAKKLVDAFGEDVFNVMDNHPERLATVKGIGKKRAAACLETYYKERALKEIIVFLLQVGLSKNRAMKVFDKYGKSAVDLIKKNPYMLCAMVGVGFSTADTVARKQGIAKDSEYRVRAGIQHVLKEAAGQGSCGLPIEKVVEDASKMLGVGYDRLEECIGFEVEAGGVIRDQAVGVDCLFMPDIYKAEQTIARLLLAHASRPISRPLGSAMSVDNAIIHAELHADLTLETTQRDAVRAALTNQVTVITGGPGTGKSTITKIILLALQDAGLEPALAAPTGKAAKRAAEATGFEAKTLHRTLELDNKGHFKKNADDPLDVDVLVLDELSMVDVKMFLAVIKAVASRTRLILIGDVDQLPSVGAGKVLADILASGVIPTVRLTQVFRQAANSDIIRVAHMVNHGEIPEVGTRKGSDFCFTVYAPLDQNSEEDKTECREDIEAEILRLAQSMYKLGYDPIKDVQVLAPMRKGILGSISLNQKLRDLLNPMPDARLTAGDAVYGTGDKVMQLKNNYDKDVFNGDIGYVLAVDEKSKTLSVEYEGRPPVTYRLSDLSELSLAYAFTIHKSQGSEFPVVIMALDMSHFMMLKRNLVYTGITRAKKLMVMVGTQAAVRTAVKNSQIDERYSRLADWLKEGATPVLAPEELLAA